MKLDVIKLDATAAGSIELDDTIFGLEPRADILQRMVRYQLAKRQAGTHSTWATRTSALDEEDLPAEGHRRRPARLAQGADLPDGGTTRDRCRAATPTT